MKYKHTSYVYDWKNKKEFSYNGINDPKYIRTEMNYLKKMEMDGGGITLQ